MEGIPEWLHPYGTKEGNTIIFSLDPSFSTEEIVSLDSPHTIIFKSSDENNKEQLPSFGGFLISAGNIQFNNIKFTNMSETQSIIELDGSKPQISLHYDHCYFTSLNETKPSIKIVENTHAFFESCTFKETKFAAILSRGGHLRVNNCFFSHIGNSALLSIKESQTNITNSKFINIRISAVFLRQSSGNLEQCFFAACGKRTLYLSDAEATCSNTTFFNLKHHAIYTFRSKIKITNIKISNTGFAGLYISCDSSCDVTNCLVENMPGNAILLENSQISVDKSKFHHISGPVATIFGVSSNCIFKNSTISECSSHAIICKDSSVPCFDHLSISNVEGNCFSLGNLSRAQITHCLIINCKGAAFSVFNGSKPLIDKNRVIQTKFLNVFAFGHPFVTNNFISLPILDTEIIKFHHNGSGTFSNNSQVTLSKLQPFTIINNSPVFLRTMTIEQQKALPDQKSVQERYFSFAKMEWRQFVDASSSNMISLSEYKPPICELCKENQSSVIVSPCGHLILCEQCSTKTDLCPLCGIPFSTKISLSDAIKLSSNECKKNCGKHSNCLCCPCFHSMTCYNCESSNTTNSAYYMCSTCRKKIQTISPLFSLT